MTRQSRVLVTATQWGLKFPNGDIEWDSLSRPRWALPGERKSVTLGIARDLRILHLGIESLPVWVTRDIATHVTSDTVEWDTREEDAGYTFRLFDAAGDQS